jgi:hypothetical protein
VQASPIDSGSQRPVSSLQRSTSPQPPARQPGAHEPPSTQIVAGGAHSESSLQPPIAMQRPFPGSHTCSPLQTRLDPGVLQPGTQRWFSQIVLGGRHPRSCVHSGRRSTHAPLSHDQPSAQSPSAVQPSAVVAVEASRHWPATHDSPELQSDA